MSEPDPLLLERHDSAATLAMREEIVPVYAAAHADLMPDPWFHPDRFWQRLVEMYAPGRDFGLVAGRVAGELVGYAFGSPRDADQGWAEVRARLPDLGLPEAPEPTYIFREFAVHPDHQRRGHGRLLHDALLAPRTEPIAQLLVRKDNTPAQAAYRSWGWRRVGDKQPFPDSPVFDRMVIGRDVYRRAGGAVVSEQLPTWPGER